MLGCEIVLFPLFLVIVGLIVAFAGKTILKFIIGFGGGLLLGLFLVRLFGFASLLNPLALLVMLIGFIIGFFLSWFLFKLAVALSLAAGTTAVLASIGVMPVAMFVSLFVFIILAAVFYILAEPIVTILASLIGISLVYMGVVMIAGVFIAIVVSLILFIIVVIYRLQKKE